MNRLLPYEHPDQRKERLKHEAWREEMQSTIAEKAKDILSKLNPDMVEPLEREENIKKIEVFVFDTSDPVARAERMQKRNELVMRMQYAISEHLKNDRLKDTKLMIREYAVFLTKCHHIVNRPTYSFYFFSF